MVAWEARLDEILAELEAEETKKVEEGAAAGQIPGGEIDPKAADVYKVEETKKELNEAVKTIKALKAELNEINLFNAKLMYVNKIFKAKNLTESQKLKVIASFDKATTPAQAKELFESIQNSDLGKKKESIKESIGFASKAAGVAPKKAIVETNDAITRMQKLANIIK